MASVKSKTVVHARNATHFSTVCSVKSGYWTRDWNAVTCKRCLRQLVRIKAFMEVLK